MKPSFVKNPSSFFPDYPFSPFIILILLLFSPLIQGGTTYYPATIIRLLLLMIFTAGVLSFYQGSPLPSLKHSVFYLPLFSILYLTVIVTQTPYQLPAIQELIFIFFYFGLFYFSFYLNHNHRQYKQTIILSLLIMTLFESCIGIYQYIFFHERARGTFFNPDFLSEYLAIGFSVSLGYILDDLQTPDKKRQNLYLILLLLPGLGIIFSQSRGGLLAWFVGITVVLWKKYRYKVVFVWSLLLLFLIAIPNPLWHRIVKNGQEDPYSFSRIQMWQESINIIQDHPMGIGIEMYPFVSTQYPFPIKTSLIHYSKIAESPHNEYLRIFTEGGFIGGGLFLLIVAFYYFRWINLKGKSITDFGILAGTFVFFVHAFSDSNFHEPALVIIVIILSTFLLDEHSFKTVSFKKQIWLTKILFYPLVAALFLIFSYVIVKPAIGWYFYSKGYTQIKSQQEDAAQFSFKKAIFWEPQNARYHNALANGYFNIFQKTNYYGWVFKALEELNQALALNPMDGNYFKLKGEIYQALAAREGNPANIQELLADAFTNFREALKLLPYDASLYAAVGSVEASSGKPEEAEKDYNHAILIEPNYLFAREKKIELLLKLGKKEEALNNYQELISVYNRVQKLATTDGEKAFIYFNQEKLKTEFNNSTTQ